jgi:hypothetical protein
MMAMNPQSVFHGNWGQMASSPPVDFCPGNLFTYTD